jgi:hypothetical protein
MPRASAASGRAKAKKTNGKSGKFAKTNEKQPESPLKLDEEEVNDEDNDIGSFETGIDFDFDYNDYEDIIASDDSDVEEDYVLNNLILSDETAQMIAEKSFLTWSSDVNDTVQRYYGGSRTTVWRLTSAVFEPVSHELIRFLRLKT